MLSFSIWCKNYLWCNKEGENGLVLVSASFSSKNDSIEALEQTLCSTPVFPVRNREKGTALKNVFVFFFKDLSNNILVNFCFKIKWCSYLTSAVNYGGSEGKCCKVKKLLQIK